MCENIYVRMEEQFLEGIRSLERLAFVNYVSVADKNGYSITSTGEVNKMVAPYLREAQNCVEKIFPDSNNIKIVFEGSSKSVVIGEQNGFLVGVQVTKDLF